MTVLGRGWRLPIHGILTIEDVDTVGETIVVFGVNLLPLLEGGLLKYGGGSNSMEDVLGRITRAEVVYHPDDEPDLHLRELAGGKPFIKVEAEVFEVGQGLKFQEALYLGVEFYFGVAGRLLSREGSTITECVAEDVLVAQNGSHQAQRVFMGRMVDVPTPSKEPKEEGCDCCCYDCCDHDR